MFESVTVIHILLFIKRIEYKMLGPFSIRNLRSINLENQFERIDVVIPDY